MRISRCQRKRRSGQWTRHKFFAPGLEKILNPQGLVNFGIFSFLMQNSRILNFLKNDKDFQLIGQVFSEFFLEISN